VILTASGRVESAYFLLTFITWGLPPMGIFSVDARAGAACAAKMAMLPSSYL
jgi:hypothetical protein